LFFLGICEELSLNAAVLVKPANIELFLNVAQFCEGEISGSHSSKYEDGLL
jgi:hypothetical protein